MRNSRDGFTIIEVLIAIIVLSIGVLALSSGAGSVTRMMYSGKNKTHSYALSASKIDSLRALAKAGCGTISGGNWAAVYGVSGAWTVSTFTNGRRIEVTTSYRNGRAEKRDTVNAYIYCP